MAKLTNKQKRFVDEYLIDLNATQAAIRAGYSEKTAKDIGCQNLAKLNIQAAFENAIAERAERTEITADRILKEIGLLALSDMKTFVRVDEGGAVQAIPFDSLPEEATRCIRKVKERRVIKSTAEGDQIMESTYEFELYDKSRCLEMAGKHLGMFIEKPTDTEPPDTMAFKMREAAQLMEEKEHGTNA